MSLENVKQILSMAGNRHIQSIFVVVLSYAGARIVAWGVARLLSRVIRRTRTPLDDEVIGMLHRPIFTTVLLSGVAVALTILQPRIINESRPIIRQRMHIPVGVAYGSDIDQVREILLEAAKTTPQACQQPEPRVRLNALGQTTLDYELLCWIDDPGVRGRVRDVLNTSIYKGLSRAGILGSESKA